MGATAVFYEGGPEGDLKGTARMRHFNGQSRA